MADSPERIRFERAHIEGAMAHYTMDGHIVVVGDEFPPERLEYVRADLFAALEQERVDLINENSILAKASEVFRVERDDLRAAIETHKHECVKCGDCGYWDQFETPRSRREG